jgi:hypothetical protein
MRSSTGEYTLPGQRFALARGAARVATVSRLADPHFIYAGQPTRRKGRTVPPTDTPALAEPTPEDLAAIKVAAAQNLASRHFALQSIQTTARRDLAAYGLIPEQPKMTVSEE